MGGHAFDDTRPIEHDRAVRMLAALRRRTGWDLEAVGSFGLRPLLPDLDLIVRQVPDQSFHFRLTRESDQERNPPRGGHRPPPGNGTSLKEKGTRAEPTRVAMRRVMKGSGLPSVERIPYASAEVFPWE